MDRLILLCRSCMVRQAPPPSAGPSQNSSKSHSALIFEPHSQQTFYHAKCEESAKTNTNRDPLWRGKSSKTNKNAVLRATSAFCFYCRPFPSACRPTGFENVLDASRKYPLQKTSKHPLAPACQGFASQQLSVMLSAFQLSAEARISTLFTTTTRQSQDPLRH